jgi:hypothetical protein
MLKAYSALGLRVLKFIPATALVESRFSLTTMTKSKHRALLGLKKMRGMLLLIAFCFT